MNNRLNEKEKKIILFIIFSDDIALLVGILIFFLLVGLIILFTFTGDAKKSASAPIRDGKVLAVTSCGYVEGLAEDSAIAFRGIPYAKPPTGAICFTALINFN